MSENPLQGLYRLGQSPWLDFIDRDLVRSGRLAALVEDGVRGVTTNPAIFEQTIAHSDHYDAEIEQRALSGQKPGAIYEALALADVQDAADVLLTVHAASGGGDGFVSLEVSPRLAHDTEATVAEARRLWAAVDRPNAMIKVPATREGLPAIRALLAEGVNINVTLIFSLERYREVADAWLAALEQRAETGAALGNVASVASFFLSRIDTLVDEKLDRISDDGGPKAARARTLRGRIAIASARCAYGIFEEILRSDRFQRLSSLGARAQRLLWASTGTKDPAYADTKYVEALVGPQTVTTLPLATLEAWRDHGRPMRERVREDPKGAAATLSVVAELMPMSEIGVRLEAEGVRKFVEPFEALLTAIETKRRGALVARGRFDAALFDLDGVVTDTARVHALCWKRVFDQLLARRAKTRGEPFRPFDLEADYLRYVDGKPRRDGVRDFLASRGVRLPEESGGAAEGEDSVASIARRKDTLFAETLEKEGVEVYPATIRWIRQLRDEGLRIAIVSASRHCEEVLRAAGLEALFDARVDGQLADRLQLAGKPAPDVFLEAARELAVEPARAIVVEDALSGVAAGRAGGFGLVVGVARHRNAAELSAAGANIVVADLAELLP